MSSDSTYSKLYSQRDMQNTDLLAFRHVAESGLLTGKKVLDLGCGTGRSSRFLTELGNQVTGVDKNSSMIAAAQSHGGPEEFYHVEQGSPLPFDDASFDAVFSSWMILELGREQEIVALFRECVRVVRPGGQVFIVTNTPEFYQGDWLSCGIDFPENQAPLKSGQSVRALLLPQQIEVQDFFWSDDDYQRFFQAAGLSVHSREYPLGREDDALPWRDELAMAPYVIYRLDRG